MSRPFYFLFASLLALVFTSCIHTATSTSDFDSTLHYSQLLQIKELNHGRTLCSIKDPWRSDITVMQYLLVPSSDTDWNQQTAEQLTDQYGQSIILRTPLERNTVTSSCHAWLLSQLNELDRIAVLCDTSYVTAQNLKDWMRKTHSDGTPQIADGGTSTAPNVEVILAANSDAIWISPFENMGLGNIAQLPIPVIYCADYMENSPLARAEWMRFYGRLVGQPTQADSLFAAIVSRYESLADTLVVSGAPKLLAELPYGATWYVPGGASTSALMYQNAGFQYLWSADRHAGSLALSQEAVVAQGQDADIWVFKYIDSEKDWTLTDFLQQNPAYSQIKAAQQGNVWGCNTAHSDFFDVTPFRPDTLLYSLKNQDQSFFHKL